jgi:hypothetical protein
MPYSSVPSKKKKTKILYKQLTCDVAMSLEGGVVGGGRLVMLAKALSPLPAVSQPWLQNSGPEHWI